MCYIRTSSTDENSICLLHERIKESGIMYSQVLLLVQSARPFLYRQCFKSYMELHVALFQNSKSMNYSS